MKLIIKRGVEHGECLGKKNSLPLPIKQMQLNYPTVGKVTSGWGQQMAMFTDSVAWFCQSSTWRCQTLTLQSPSTPTLWSSGRIPDLLSRKKGKSVSKLFSLFCLEKKVCLSSGLHKLWYPSIRDTSTWSIVRSTWRTWRCFFVLQLRCALILKELKT